MQTANTPALRTRAVAGLEQLQRAQLARLRDKLHIDEATFDKLVNLLAEDMQLFQESYARCILDPACDMTNVPPATNHDAEIQALLGPDRYAKMQQYRSMSAEWQVWQPASAFSL